MQLNESEGLKAGGDAQGTDNRGIAQNEIVNF